MPVQIDYASTRTILDKIFALAVNDLRAVSQPSVPEDVDAAVRIIFASKTQAYREVLLGSALARLANRSVDIRSPYANQGDYAYNGRTLDEKVINPFFHENRIPSTKGPFLSVFRRSVRFTEAIRAGMRDLPGYDAFLACLAYLESIESEERISGFIRHLLYRFAQLRETATIPIAQVQRISLDQYASLLEGLLATQSGGRFPVMLVVATFGMLKEYFGIDWTVEVQGINVADSASGAGGDITIRQGGRIVLAAEVTERELLKSRVVSIFNTKIAPTGLEDYVFFLKSADVNTEVTDQAARYFAQGHEMTFVEIQAWMLMLLATTGARGRGIFNRKLIELLDTPDTPVHVKTAWNEQLSRVIG